MTDLAGSPQSPPAPGPDAPGPLEALLAPAMLEREAFPAIYERGLAYEKHGKVELLSLTPLELTARVAGGGDEPYEVVLLAHPEAMQFHTWTCTCPFGVSELGPRSFCKHMIAAGIAGLRRYGIEREAAALLGACAEGAAPARKPAPRI